MAGLTVIVVLVALALVVPRYGADTHTSDGWTAGLRQAAAPRVRARVRSDVAMALRAVRGVHIPGRRSAHGC